MSDPQKPKPIFDQRITEEVRITVFDNGDTYVLTNGDILVLGCRHIFDNGDMVR